MIRASLLNECAKGAGLQVLGVSNVEPLTNDTRRLRIWQDAHYSAEMQYMRRDPQALSDIRSIFPAAQSIIMTAISYEAAPISECPKGYGKVARYAWGKDYHVLIPKRLTYFGQLLLECESSLSFKVFSDAIPLLERAFAHKAGIGFIGKNSMLISLGIGSFTLLGGIALSIPVEEIVKRSHSGSCGPCTRCKDNCPTEAIVSDRIIDARKCISYLTIEKRGMLTPWEREALGEWIFGCDICQEVCPFNHKSLKKGQAPALSQLSQHYGVGPFLSLKDLFSLNSNEKFKVQFRETPLLRPKRAGLLRNGLAVAANTNSLELVGAIRELINEDPADTIRATAAWALWKLGEDENRRNSRRVLERCLKDPSKVVREEARRLLDNSCETVTTDSQ